MTRYGTGPLAALLLATAFVFAACSPPGKGRDVPAYEAVPDNEIFAAVSELPGVTGHTLSFDADSFGRANNYSGTVTAERGTDGRVLLDQVLALLWQGHLGASYGIAVEVDGAPLVTPRRIGLELRSDWPDRYGPQPGTGVPPTDKPLPPEAG